MAAVNRALTLLEKVVLGFIAGAAAAIGVLSAVFLAGRVIRLATPGPTTLSNVPLAEPVPADLDASPGSLTAQYDTMTLVAADIPESARAALIASAVLTSLLTIGVCAAVAWLSIRVFVGRPFVRSATWGISVVAILILVAGLGGPLLDGIARTETAAAAGEDGLALLLFEVDLAPLGWAFALIVVAAAFEIGQRLQRDTRGLV